jgi:hypothetical protein
LSKRILAPVIASAEIAAVASTSPFPDTPVWSCSTIFWKQLLRIDVAQSVSNGLGIVNCSCVVNPNTSLIGSSCVIEGITFDCV